MRFVHDALIDKSRKLLQKFWSRKRLRVFVLAGALMLGIVICTPLPSPLFPPDYSTVVLSEDRQILRAFLNEDEQWLFPQNHMPEIPEKLRLAVLTYEDRYFDYHPGINPVAVARAMYQNWESDDVVSGASTITMQVCRLAGRRDRTYFNKMFEMLQALKLELFYSKAEILELYLSYAPYGGNIIGVQAAALRYYEKYPTDLTWSEAATLAVLPNAPGLISPDKNPDALKAKRNRLLNTLMKYGHINSETLALAIDEPMPAGTIHFDMRAAHLARELKREQSASGGMIRTTINLEIQRWVEDQVHHHMDVLSYEGLRNASAIVAETKSGKIRAYVGSQDFHSFETKGQVDGVQAWRSSGSILKPFLYALAIDEGLIVPESLIRDVPTFFDSYSPANADELFRGIISSKEALVRSLNVPATRLLNNYGIDPFYHFLKEAGVNSLFRTADDYGLPLILGGAEVSVWDMAKVYRGLGNMGKFDDLHVLAQDRLHPADTGVLLISEMAALRTLNMLRELKRPGAEYYWDQYENQWPLAWKTGTSYGQRDAWAAGVSPKWTVVVWVGNFDGEGNANLGGAKSAGPLLFDIFNYLPKAGERRWFSAADSLKEPLEICMRTGYQLSESCPETQIVEVPRRTKPLRICPYHNSIYVDSDADYRVCSACWETDGYQRVSELVFPPDVVQYLRQRGQLVGAPAPHNPACPEQFAASPIEIIYPQMNARLLVPVDFGGVSQQVVLRAAHREHQKKMYWYLDDRYLGETEQFHEYAVAMTPGWHQLKIVDAVGFKASCRFYVVAKD